MTERRKGLGRGLGALIPTGPTTPNGGGVATLDRARPVDVFFSGGQASPSPAAAGQGGAPATQRAEPDTAHDNAESPPAEADISETRSDAAVDTSVEDAPQSGAAEPGPTDPDLLGIPGLQFREVPLAQIVANPRQPRQVFDEDELAELVTSIREVGVLQPIVVRPATDGYELVMGERRWRACQQAGLELVPAIIRDTPDTDLLRDALLENLHRSQLNPLEEAAAYDQLLKDFACSHEELAGRIGRSRPQISNTIRLLNLPPLVQRRVAAGVISAGHARALLGLIDQAAMERLAQRIVAEGLSVRATEEIVALGGDEDAPKRPRTPRRQPHDERLEQFASHLSDRLETRVKIAMTARRGRLTVEFAGVDDLERIMALLSD